MEKIDIIIEKLEKLENKVDSIGNELNNSMISQSVCNEKTERNEEDIKEIKERTIEEKILASQSKMKVWFFSGATGILISIIISLFNYLK